MSEQTVRPAGTLAHARGAYLSDLDDLNRDAAVSRVRALTAEGHAVTDVVLNVLAPAQKEVGRLWEQGKRSVAWEHAATSITECALLATAVPSPEQAPARVVMVCAEGEGHTLAARMQAHLLSFVGCDPILLLPPMDAAQLEGFLMQHPLDAVAVSCTLPRHLPGCPAIIDAAHRAGLPVIAGGAAFRADCARAVRLGADHCSDDPHDVAGRLASWRGNPPVLAHAAPVPPEHEALHDAAEEIMEDAMLVLAREYPGWPADWSETDAAREDFRHALGLVGAALLVDDERIVGEGLAWRRSYWRGRGEGPQAMTTRLQALAESLPDGLATSKALLAGAMAA